MDPAFRSLMWYLLVGTRGGPNRWRILERLHRAPANAHQVASELGLDYRTVRHHLRILEQNRVVVRTVPGAYAPPYELSPYFSGEFAVVRATIAIPDRTQSHPRAARSPATLTRSRREAA